MKANYRIEWKDQSFSTPLYSQAHTGLINLSEKFVDEEIYFYKETEKYIKCAIFKNGKRISLETFEAETSH